MAEVTGGAMRAVGFRRQEGIFDFARRFRFAYSLEHYNNFTGKPRIQEESEFLRSSHGRIWVACGANYSTVGCQWSVVSGQWSVVICPEPSTESGPGR